MPNNYAAAGAAGMQNMDWTSEVNGDVVAYDDPAALRDNAANVRAVSGMTMPAQPQRLTGGAESMTMPDPMSGGMGAMPMMRDPVGIVGADQRETLMPQVTQPTLDMSNSLPQYMIGAPQNSQQAYLGSLKAMLAKNVGNYISATFLVGTQNLVTWDGVLYTVGNDFLTIYQVDRDRYIVCDYYSLKYMEFYDTKRRILCNQLLAQQGNLPENS